MKRPLALALLFAAGLAMPMPAIAQDGAPVSVNVNMASRCVLLRNMFDPAE